MEDISLTNHTPNHTQHTPNHTQHTPNHTQHTPNHTQHTPNHTPYTPYDSTKYKSRAKRAETKVNENNFDAALTKKSYGQGSLNLIAIQGIIMSVVAATTALSSDSLSRASEYRYISIICIGSANIVTQFIVFCFIAAQANMRHDNMRIRADTMNTIVTVLSTLSLLLTLTANLLTTDIMPTLIPTLIPTLTPTPTPANSTNN
jgi:heme/copper-type cytochrome/quinol oxidase subunit 4